LNLILKHWILINCTSGSVGTKFSLNSEELWVWLLLLITAILKNSYL
jgi:hypothetical protein